MWFTTNYGQRVCLDVVALEDPDDPKARYRIDWDAKPPVAISVRKLGYMPDHPEDPRFSTHFDTCTMRDKVATT